MNSTLYEWVDIAGYIQWCHDETNPKFCLNSNLTVVLLKQLPNRIEMQII